MEPTNIEQTIEQMQPNTPPAIIPKKSKIWLWIVIGAVIVLIAALGWWYLKQPTPSASPQQPTTEENAPISNEGGEENAPLRGGDTMEDISKDLEAVDLGDIDSELNELNKDINVF